MIALALLAVAMAPQDAAAPSAKSATPRFGAFLEQLDDRPNTGFAACDSRGKVWTVHASTFRAPNSAKESREAEARGQCCPTRATSTGIAFAPSGDFYLTDALDDAVFHHPQRDLVADGRGDASSYLPIGSAFARRGRGLGELRAPAGLAFDPLEKGRVLVADTLNHRISVFDAAGKPLATLGVFGAGQGQLNHPNDVAVDAGGAAFVADVGNDRIVKFDAQGKFQLSFGGRGSYPGLFAAPTGVDVHGDRLYVADRDNHRIQVFDLDGNFVYEWGVHALLPREGHGKLHYPTDVVVSPAGDRVAVVEPMEDRVQVFGPAADDAVLTTPERDTAAHYGGYCSARGDLFAIAEPSGPSVSIFDLTRGTPIEITRFGRPGTSAGRLLRPTSVLLDARAELVYVADPYARRLSVFHIARKPDEPLRFDPFLARFVRSVELGDIEPEGLALGEHGDILLVDAALERVVVFDTSLELVRTFGQGALRRPRGIAVDRDTGETFVSTFNLDSSRVVVFARDGSRLKHLDGWSEPGQQTHAFGVALSRTGGPWTTDPGTSALQKVEDLGLEPRFAPPPTIQVVRSQDHVGRAEFFKPEGVATDDHGRVFVVDAGNHRFQILDADGKYLDMWGARFFTEAGRTPPAPAPAAHAWDGARSVATIGGSWRVVWRAKTNPIPRGNPFAIEAWVFAPGEPNVPARGINLAVDAWMPEHVHGMTRVPTVTPRDDGGFTVEGLYFHMPGFWELDLDVVSKAVAERATVRIDLE